MKGENLKRALGLIRDDAQILFNGSPNVTIQRVDFSEDAGGYVANIILAPQDANPEPAIDNEAIRRKLGAIADEEARLINRIREAAYKESQMALNAWAGANAKFKIGDIITDKASDSGTIIRVDKITGDYSKFSKSAYVVYSGRALTKQFKERKDGWTTNIYDDCPTRDIVKLK